MRGTSPHGVRKVSKAVILCSLAVRNMGITLAGSAVPAFAR